MRRWGSWLWLALVVPACVGYQLLVHSAIMDGQPGYVRVTLALLPLLALAYWIARYAQHKVLWTLFLLAACGTIYAIEHAARLGLAAAYGLSHTAIYMFLLWLFGRTLVRGREPLITGFARRVHGTLPQEMEAYTRRITLAWCAFFIAQAATSAALFAWASLDTWSLLVNVLNLPLLVLMFGGEYLYRVIRHRDFPHASIMKGIQMFSEYKPLANSADIR